MDNKALQGQPLNVVVDLIQMHDATCFDDGRSTGMPATSRRQANGTSRAAQLMAGQTSLGCACWPAPCHPAPLNMPSSRRGGPPGPDPHLLFTALLTRNCSWAAQLLLSSQAQQLSHEGPAGFTTRLHRAAAGAGCRRWAAPSMCSPALLPMLACVLSKRLQE